MDGIADGSMKKKDFSKAEQHCDSEAQRVHFIVKNIRLIERKNEITLKKSERYILFLCCQNPVLST